MILALVIRPLIRARRRSARRCAMSKRRRRKQIGM